MKENKKERVINLKVMFQENIINIKKFLVKWINIKEKLLFILMKKDIIIYKRRN